MMINALNSGARVFMADLEDALSPTWANIVGGQAALREAVRRTLELTTPRSATGWPSGRRPCSSGRAAGTWRSATSSSTAVRSRRACSTSACSSPTTGRESLARGSGPYLYLAKLESHREARLWNEVFLAGQAAVGIPAGSIRATVLIETILAAFEMDEILHELRDHAAGLNAGRWDYIFSIIKKFRDRPGFVLPDRGQVTMAVPFMRAYTQLLVRTCHRRGAHAIGGMSAFIPNRRQPEVTANALARVREDKEREAGDGFDGTWVAHPDLVPIAGEVFDQVLGKQPNQKGRLREDVVATAGELLDVAVPGGRVDRGRRPPEHQRRAALPRRLAPGQRRGGDRQPHGGRGHGRDQPLPALAVVPSSGDPRRRARRSTTTAIARSVTTSSPATAGARRVASTMLRPCSTGSSWPTTSPSS